MMESNYLGVGLYTVSEAARLVRVPPSRLRRWLKGYRTPGRVADPVVHRDFGELQALGLMTFVELIELMLVSHFRKAGVSLQGIRENLRIARKRLQTSHPFAVQRFHVLGKDLIAESITPVPTEVGPKRLYEDLRKSQLVLDQVAEALFDKITYEDDLARKYWPLGKSRLVVLDPARAFGQATDPETAVPTSVLYGAFQAGEGIDEIACAFRVKPLAVQAAIEYEQYLAQAA